MLHLSAFIFHRYGPPRPLHSFPTRRSSDLRISKILPLLDGVRCESDLSTKGNTWFPLRVVTEHVWAICDEAMSVNANDKLCSPDRKSTRLNSSHSQISYAVFCCKKKKGTRA